MNIIKSLRFRTKKIIKILLLRIEYYNLGIKLYKPTEYHQPLGLPKSKRSAWQGLDLIINDIIKKSGIDNKKCLEFGTEFGYSTAAFANYFENVTGVDLFTGDIHAGFKGDILKETSMNLKDFNNIELIRADYRDYILDNNNFFDLIHVDIVHTYEHTYSCGIWAAKHSNCTLFHDTESYPEVKKAVLQISKETGKTFYNYPKSNGLGILF